MTEVFTAETVIDSSVEEVWAQLIDWEGASRWMPGVDELRAQGPTATGTALVFTARGKERIGQIAAVDPGRSITLRSIQGGVTADYFYACVPHGEGDAGTPGGQLPADRSRAAARPGDQGCYSSGGQRAAECVRRHVPTPMTPVREEPVERDA